MPNKKNQFNGHIMWFSGMSGSGKTTLTKAVKSLLDNDGYNTQIIDGDNKRAKDKKKLSFSKKDIIKNNLSIANICNKERASDIGSVSYEWMSENRKPDPDGWLYREFLNSPEVPTREELVEYFRGHNGTIS